MCKKPYADKQKQVKIQFDMKNKPISYSSILK